MEQKEIDKKTVLELMNSVNVGTTSVMLPLKRIYNQDENLKTGIIHTREASLLCRIRRLFEGLIKYCNIEINEGAILNISVVLFKFIRDNGLKLEYDDKRERILGISQTSGEFSIEKSSEGLQVEMAKVGRGSHFYPETAITATLNGNVLKGKAHEFGQYRNNNYSITFKKNGLLDTIEYHCPIFLSENWPHEEEPILNTKITYGKDEYQIEETLTQGEKNIDTHKYINRKYLDASNRMIDKIPGVIDVWHQQSLEQQVHQVIGVDNEIIESVFGELWNRADTKEYKEARIRTRKIMDEQNKPFK